MLSVAVIVPVLKRPHRVQPLVDSLVAAEPPKHFGIRVFPLFVCSPDDTAELAAIDRADVRPLVVDWEAGPGDYARKINVAARKAQADYLLLAADDVTFHDRWLEAALAVHFDTGACVVGTNDLANARVTSGQHATHLFVCSGYLECGTIDEPDSGMLLCPLYDHNFVDDECVATAQFRGTYAFASESKVRHSHPTFGTAEVDDTYRKGLRHFEEDRALYNQRRHLWGGKPR